MDHASNRAEINEAMQRLPAFAPEAANPSFGRGDGERDQQNESGESDCYKSTLGYIVQHFVQVEKFIQPDVSEEMQCRVEERKQSKHAPVADQPKPPRKLANGCDR